MSVDGREWAWSLPATLTPNQRLVALVLGDTCRRDTEQAWPSIATIAGRTKLAKSSVTDALRLLISQGFITVDRSPGGRGRSSIYTLIGADGAAGLQVVDNPPSPVPNCPSVGLDTVRESAVTVRESAITVRDSDKNQLTSNNPIPAPEPVVPRTGLTKRRAGEIARQYAQIAIAGRSSPPANFAAYVAACTTTALAHPDLDRWMAEYPHAAPSAIAAWLHGDTHSMAYCQRVVI